MIPDRAKPFVPLVRLASQKYHIPEGLILAVIEQESRFRPTAFRLERKINDASYGLMQILYRTAVSLGYKGDRDYPGEAAKLSGLFDPATSIDLGTKLLAQNKVRAGNWSGAISAYNGGWRPKIGFGIPATHDLSICLARDEHGDCIKRRDVKLGEYANRDYVDAILARWKVYTPDDFGGEA